jgi:hypothetical protein
MLALCGVGGAFILWAGRHLTFWYDEWGLILYRRDGGLDAFLAPHNGHLQPVIVAIYRGLFDTVGLRHYLPYQLVGLTSHLAVVLLLYAYARRRLSAAVALLLPLPVLLMAWAWQVLVWPQCLGFTLPLACLLGILVLRDRGDRGDAATAALLLVAVGTSGVGLVALLVIAFEKLLAREPWRRWWSVALPAAMYGAWYVAYRPGASTPGSLRAIPTADPGGDVGVTDIRTPSLRGLLTNIETLARASADALLGFAPGYRTWVGLGLLLAIAVGAARATAGRHRAIALAAGVGALWLLIGATRTDLGGPAAGRYMYSSAVLLVALTVEALRDIPWRPAATAVLAVAVSAILAADVRTTRRYEASLDAAFAEVEAALRSVEDRRGSIPPDTLVHPSLLPGVRAGAYFAAIDALGSPVSSEDSPDR